jgi:hypothetical protein
VLTKVHRAEKRNASVLPYEWQPAAGGPKYM